MKIGNNAFWGCSKLDSITIPDSVVNIGNSVFSFCSSLNAINVSDKNKYYSSEKGVLFNKGKTELLQYPEGKSSEKYIIPDGVENIGSYAFYNCQNLTEITIPDSVTSIGKNAFFKFKSLTEVTIPDSVTSIENNAFSVCSNLTEITVPESVESIGEDAFCDCSKLDRITIENPECEIYDDKYTISDTAVIYGYADSTAQAYAEKYDRKFTVLENSSDVSQVRGDSNGDGQVDVADVVSISAYVANPEINPISAQAIKNADVHNTGDGLTASDALMIQQYLAGSVEL